MLQQQAGVRALALAVVSASVVLSASARADVVIGNWENGSNDGWIDWGTQAAIEAPKYTFDAFGATAGTSSLKITHNGWNQNLSLKLQNNGLLTSFFANKQFKLDFSVPGNTGSGWNEIYTLWINAQDYGFQQQGTTVPAAQFGFPNGGPQTRTITWDYAALVDGNTGNGEIPATSGWVEFILATNSSDETTGVFYMDNARLVNPVARGDFNADGFINAADIDLLFAEPAGEATPATLKFDVNNDGYIVKAINSANSDADEWVRNIKDVDYGDANLDQSINFDDLLVLAANYNTATGSGWAKADFNGDQATNFDDLLLLAAKYNTTTAGGFAGDWALAQAVPEPASLTLLAATAGLMMRRRRR